MSARLIMKLNVAGVRDAGGGVRVYVLKHPLRPSLPPPSPGAHVDVRLPDGRVRHYSLCGDPADATRYVIAVKCESAGRGGSQWIHENFAEGFEAHVSAPRNHFPLAADAVEHILVAGGIGITPLIGMARHLQRTGQDFTLHYCARSAATAPLLDDTRRLFGERLRGHFSNDPASRFDAASVLADRSPGAHVYCCGPNRLVDAVRSATTDWPARRVHFEMFAPLPQEGTAEPFDISIASTGATFTVPADRSALAVLRDNGFQIASSCEIGVCGSCESRYRSGTVIHRDVVLDAEARSTRMLLCVSRATDNVVLDL